MTLVLRIDKKKNLIDLGTRIRQIRKSKGLTQMSLAHIIGKDHPSINRLEKGKTNPSYLFLKEVAKGLGVEVYMFFQKEPGISRY